MTPQRLGRLEVNRRPRFAALVDDFAPPLEGLAGAQPNAAPFPHGDGLVVRIAAPIHRIHCLAPEPNHVLLVGQVQRERAGRVVRIEIEIRELIEKAFGSGDFITGTPGPAGHCGHDLGRRDRAQRAVLPADVDRHTRGRQEVEQTGGVE